MLDFHSHILPEIDDGAQNVEESLAMLKMLKEQDVDTVALTSHYIAMDESPESFIERRTKSYEILKKAIKNSTDDFPKLRLGAEVYYYPGLCKIDDIQSLALEGTDLLLLEMPMAPWGEFTIRELIDFANTSETTLVIAHIERSLKYQKKDTIEKLLNNGILFQVNASFFISRKTRRKALKMLNSGYIHFIGSDCHNIKYRPPKIKEALDIIAEKLGNDAINELESFSKNYL